MERRFEGVGWERAVDEAVEDLPPPPPPTLEGYGPLRRRANLAWASLAVVTLVTVVAIVFDVAERSLLVRIGAGELVSRSEIDASDNRQLVIGLLQLGLLLVTAGFFIAWLHRAYKNLPPLGSERLRFGTGWAIGGWFVPLLNLFRPKQVVNDVWRGSDPDVTHDREEWREGDVPLFLTLWWLLYLLSGVLGNAAFGGLRRAEDPDAFERHSEILIAVDVVTALAGILAILVVDRTTARQAARVAAIAGEDHPGAKASRWHRSPKRLAIAVVLCLAAVGAGILTVQASSSAAGDEGTIVAPSPNAPASSSFRDDFSDQAGDWYVHDDESVTYAYRDGAYRMVVKNPEETWFSLYGFLVSMPHAAMEADAVLREGSTESGVGIGCFSSEAAGYLFFVSPDGYFSVEFDPEDSEQLVLLTDGTAPNAIRGSGETNRLGIECTGGSSATIVASINGREVDEATHEGGFSSFQILALAVFSGPRQTGVTVDFDNVLVRRLDP